MDYHYWENLVKLTIFLILYSNIYIKIQIFRPQFVLQKEKLIRNRIYSSCGLIKGRDGLPVLAIVRGDMGMEIWNPRTGEVELVWD